MIERSSFETEQSSFMIERPRSLDAPRSRDGYVKDP
jgi:hypothetical protein